MCHHSRGDESVEASSYGALINFPLDSRSLREPVNSPQAKQDDPDSEEDQERIHAAVYRISKRVPGLNPVLR